VHYIRSGGVENSAGFSRSGRAALESHSVSGCLSWPFYVNVQPDLHFDA